MEKLNTLNIFFCNNGDQKSTGVASSCVSWVGHMIFCMCKNDTVEQVLYMKHVCLGAVTPVPLLLPFKRSVNLSCLGLHSTHYY